MGEEWREGGGEIMKRMFNTVCSLSSVGTNKSNVNGYRARDRLVSCTLVRLSSELHTDSLHHRFYYC